MEPDDTVALYERILLLLKPRNLHCSSNLILQDDILALRSSIDSVVASFVKVEEVRDAVNQLKHGKVSTCFSKSLLDEMNRTEQLQQKLQETLEKIATRMEVADVTFTIEKEEEKREKRKRKQVKNGNKNEEKMNEVASCVSQDEDNHKRKKQQRKPVSENEEKKMKEESAKKKKQNDDLSIANKALTEILKVRTVNKRMQVESKNTWVLALFDIKRVLKHQSSHNAQTIDKSALEVVARALNAAIVVFRNLEWTAEHIKEVLSVIAVLTDACSKNETLQSFFHQARVQLESLEMSIHAPLTQSSVNTKPASAGSSLDHQLQTYHNLVNDMHTQPPRAKAKRILQALIAIQQVMAGDDLGTHQIDVRHSITDVRRWICETPNQNDLFTEYTRFANGITAYSKMFPDKPKQMEWQRLGASVLTLLDEKTNISQPASTLHLHSRFSTTTSKIQGRLVSVMDQVEQWQDGIFSMNQVDKALKMLNEVVSYKSKDWNPYSDQTVRDCLEKLTTCIKMINREEGKTHRDKCLKTLSRWIAACNNLR
ncbi:hypothetical protein KXD40_004792 [Peronospora effusa]|nr:hypothetical protein KXD40_004792 [Peronospora effusa]